ncbi:hypothetical protein A0256_00400 [Mucilaginibacter sp. PAMC 26640]|nr:hypothetical protein A0256_00400 [Mucilaginibacter sp. PAMC 26640]
MEDRFTELEINAYKSKVDLIMADIESYRQNLKNSQDYNFGKAGLEEYQLDKLEQAFNDLENFYDNGKKAWFRIYKDITQNYRFGQGLNGVWVNIASLYDSFWIELNLPEKMFVTMSTFKFRLPNLKNKVYSSFEEQLKSTFEETLKKVDKDFVLEIDSKADTYGIRVRKITLPVMYTIVCSASNIRHH